METQSHTELKREDFRRLPFNMLDKKPIMKAYPEQFTERPFQFHIKAPSVTSPRDKFLRFIILYFDYRSPIQDLNEEVDKVNTSLFYAGFRRDSGEWSNKVLDVIHGKDKVFTLQATCYMMKNGGSAWTLIKTMERRLYQNFNKIYAGVEEKDLLKNTESLQASLEMKKREFFGELYNLQNAMNFDRYFVKEQLYLTPEDIADLLEEEEYG